MEKLFKFSSKYMFPSDPATGTLGSINLNISFIQLCGVPLLGAMKESRRLKRFLIIYGSVVMSLTTFAYLLLELHDLILCWKNLNELTQNTCLSFTHFAGAIKVVNVFYRRKDIIRIIEKFKFLVGKYVVSEKQKEAFYWGEFENKMILTFYFTSVGFTGFMGMMMILFNPAYIAGKIFPYRNEMPAFIPYNIQVVYMAVAVLYYAVQIVGVDYLNVNFINQTRYQMKILNIAFDNLAVSDEFDMDANEYIKTLVEHHTIILEIRNQIDSVFKFPLLLQFLTSLLIFAMTGFQATVQTDSSIAILVYFYSGCILCQLFVYCWFGNEVSEQNKTLASRGYNSLWYNFDGRYKRSLMIFLIIAERPFNYTAGGFIELSLMTFSEILSKSYTYIAVLHQIYAEK